MQRATAFTESPEWLSSLALPSRGPECENWHSPMLAVWYLLVTQLLCAWVSSSEGGHSNWSCLMDMGPPRWLSG